LKILAAERLTKSAQQFLNLPNCEAMRTIWQMGSWGETLRKPSVWKHIHCLRIYPEIDLGSRELPRKRLCFHTDIACRFTAIQGFVVSCEQGSENDNISTASILAIIQRNFMRKSNSLLQPVEISGKLYTKDNCICSEVGSFMKNPNDHVVIFKTDDEKISVDVRFDEETVWLSLDQMSDLFERDKSTVSRHIKNVYEEGELERSATVANFATVQNEGGRIVERQIEYFNLDVIISVGYRVKSLRGTQFRKWATGRLNEYIRKGFTMDDERLKNGGGRYFRELLQRIRDIRSSERNLYQQVTDIYATSIDYDPKAKTTREFFATVQNKMHYAAHKHTAVELIYERVDSDKPNVGMTNFKGEYATKSDVVIAKNYLTERELTVLNLLVSQFLDFAELQALEERPMTMTNWIDELDRNLLGNRRDVLQGRGKISKKQAFEKAEEEFEIYRAREMAHLVSDFDRAVKNIAHKDVDSCE